MKNPPLLPEYFCCRSFCPELGFDASLRSSAEFGEDLPGEMEGEGNVEDGEEFEDRGLLGLCPALPNDPPAPPALCPTSLGLAPLDPSSSIFSAGILEFCVPGASATAPDNGISVQPRSDFASSSVKVILDPPGVAVPTCPSGATWLRRCQSLRRSEAGLEGGSGEEARTPGVLAPARVAGGLCC